MRAVAWVNWMRASIERLDVLPDLVVATLTQLVHQVPPICSQPWLRGDGLGAGALFRKWLGSIEEGVQVA